MSTETEDQTVIILKWEGASQVEQDVSAFYYPYESQVYSASWTRKTGSSIVLRIPQDESLDYQIKSLQEIWIGIRDEDGTWTRADFGGYLGQISKGKHAGLAEYHINLYTYDHDLETIEILGWPFDITQPIPYDAPDDAILGFPPNTEDEGEYHPSTWLVGEGGPEPPGILRVYMPGIDYDGVDDDFGAAAPSERRLFFDLYNRPTKGDVVGELMLCSLKDGIDEILKCAMWVAQNKGFSLRPVYWMKPVVNGTRIRPQFRLRDLNNTGGVDLSFTDADTHPEGYYSYFDDFTIVENPEDLRNQVTVVGPGGSIYNVGGVATYKTVYVTRNVTVENYPAPYHKPPFEGVLGGWAGSPVLHDKIDNINLADDLADTIGRATDHPQVAVIFKTDEVVVEEGMMIHFISVFADFDQYLPVIEVNETKVDGIPVYESRCGYQDLGMNDVINGPAVDFMLLRDDMRAARAQDGYGNILSVPNGSGAITGVNRSPAATLGAPLADSTSFNQGNVFQAGSDSVTTMVYNQPTNLWLRTSSGAPINPTLAAINGAFPPAVAPMPTAVYWGSSQTAIDSADPTQLRNDKRPKDWYDANNNNHPIHYPLMFFSDEWQTVTLPTPCKFTTVKVKQELDADANPVLPPGVGVTITLRKCTITDLSYSCEDILGSAISDTNPLIIDYNNSLAARVDGSTGGNMLGVELSEKDPDPTDFGGVRVVP